MTRFSFQVTIPANGAAAVNLAAAAFAGTPGVSYPNGHQQTYGTGYLPFCRLEAFVADGATGEAYIGPSNVTYQGANAPYVLAKPGAGLPGPTELIASYKDNNIGDLSQYNIHGANPGDVVTVIYHQA